MATKQEIADIEELIELYTETNADTANGLIMALNELIDDPVDLIEVEAEPELPEKPDMTGTFSWAMHQSEINGLKVYQESDIDSVLTFEDNRYVLTSPMRGREVLRYFNTNMVKGKDWKIVGG